MGFGKDAAGAWASASGSMPRRVMTFGLRVLMRAEEGLTDLYYRRHGLWTMGNEYDLNGASGGSDLMGYAPIRWRALRKIFTSWPIPSDGVLIDYGSGKGRTVVWAAANYRLRRVIGIELNERLHASAEANLARWNGRLLCDNVEFLCADATEFKVPDDVTIVYFFNPFTGPVFDKVVGKIQESLDRNPRDLVILYWHPRMHDSLIKAGFSVERQQMIPPNDWAIYQHLA